MFDVGFSELVLIALVALLVFGPERLPRLVRETALWLRKARSALGAAKAEIDQELQLYELRQSLKEKREQMERELLSLDAKHPAELLPRPQSLTEDRETQATEEDIK